VIGIVVAVAVSMGFSRVGTRPAEQVGAGR
jgi:hypothetical protein